MEKTVEQIAQNKLSPVVWALTHPSLYTYGPSTKLEDIINPHGIPVYPISRGGKATYHGPGQRVYYVMLNLHVMKVDLHTYLRTLEQWIIHVLAQLGIVAQTIPGKTGVWVSRKKIAAIGVQVRKWVTFYGFSLNNYTNLSYFDGIVPCGLDPKIYTVTSLKEQGISISEKELDQLFFSMFPFVK